MLLLLFLTIPYSVLSACWCSAYIRSRHGSHLYRVTEGCNDDEMRAECQRAEWEMVDWVNAVMAYDRTLTLAYPPEDKKRAEKDQAALSYAIEEHRPVPDCATGLFTTSAVDGDSWDYFIEDDDADQLREGSCYSKHLLDECIKVKNGVKAYMSNVMTDLANAEASPEFIEMMRVRVEGSIEPTITCETTERNKALTDAAASPKKENNYWFLVIFMVWICILLMVMDKLFY